LFGAIVVFQHTASSFSNMNSRDISRARSGRARADPTRDSSRRPRSTTRDREGAKVARAPVVGR
jgi:hypothetical protein